MTVLQKIELRRSEIRERLGVIAGLEGEARTEAITGEQSGLMTELRESEPRLQAAIAAEEQDTRLRNPGDGANAEHRALIGRCNLGVVYATTLEHRHTEGPERELQEALGLASNQIPLELLEVRAATPAPTDVGQNQSTIVPGVFPMACAGFLAIDMPRVPTGDAVFPVLTQNAEVKTPAENAAAAETTGSFSADVLSPARIQASFFYSREDRARFGGMDESLRENLSMALSDGLDAQVLAGPNGLLTATNLPANAAGAADSFLSYRKRLVYDRIDGTYASTAQDLRIVMGGPTYANASEKYEVAGSDRSALEVLERITGNGVKVSAHVLDVNANKQNAIVRRGMRRDMVAPIWEGITLIPDEITKAGSGQIVVTAVMLHAVKILRAAGFAKVETQHA